jgi:uncharacterized membrane protein
LERPCGHGARASGWRGDKIPLVALDRRLGRWVEAGLIASDQAEAIAVFERDRGRPAFLYAVAGLGGLAIFIGFVSIVAANWGAIPGRVKIGVDLVLVAALGQTVAAFDRRGQALAREIAILVIYGAVLASIALIGQVYQLGGQLHSALSIWTLLTALVLAWGRSAILAFVWAMGLQATYWAWLARLAERPGIEEAWMVGAVVWAPLVLLLVGRSAWLTARRSAFARMFRAVGWAELVLAGTVGSAAFYTDTRSQELQGLWLGMPVSAVLAGVLFWQMNRSAGDRMSRWLLVACLVLTYVPALISPGDLDVLAALCSIVLWFLVALTAHRSGSAPLLNLATAVIGIRLLVVYFEVFGSLLSTGVGLVSGGLLTLGLLWLWLRKRRDFAEALATRGDQL